ncbi:LysM peptidoglycan-binding domain-containing protein [Stappia sp. BW2]|uniref:LysM peptidoglycan-binding domain-containing protein n=1 Tax=Stappia sp. BW2 TaxID=2592622 RepID=UPI0011DEC327|nr:LysM peptidoglycan-binding domain-containing protein [Stappia sp. BW2]TYC66865.1 LysM peptidoglycan-binding domain-containing protein [Stappia sp. BW2]
MNNKTLIWTLIVAVPVGLAALVTGYIYRDTGHLPFQNGADIAATPTVSGDKSTAQQSDGSQTNADDTVEKTAQADTAKDEPAVDAAKAGPHFDVVGVEPTGETVVAGRSVAGAIVALTANGKVVGKSIANEVGEWTIILDEPLKPGDYDVGLEVHDDTGKAIATSEERLAVSLPKGGKEQPLVVLNTPDGPSDILQKPATEQQVASATTATSTEEGTAAQAEGQALETESAAGKTPAETAASVAKNQQSASKALSTALNEKAADVQDQTAVASAETKTNGITASASSAEAQGQPATDTPAGATEVASAPAAGAAPSTDARQQAASDTADAGGQQGSSTVVASASKDEAAAVPEAAADAPTVTVEAVESEKDKVFIAGTGEPGSSVRVYVDDDFQGEAKVGSSGKWLVQGGKNVDEGNVEIRADLIGEDGNSVDARAAVTFEKEEDKQIVLTKVIASGEGAGAEGQGAEVKKSLPVVIIRKGDNLWRISRRLYGEGFRYTTIYKANQEQIRNPDLIYPGQVFLTPEGDLNWPKPKGNNG